MKKIILLIPLLMLMGCSKQIELPKLKAKDMTVEHTEKIDFTYDNLIDTSEFSDEQMEELEKNGEIDTSDLVYDSEGNYVAGTYEIEVSYYEDVVDCILTVTDNTMPIFNDVSEVEVPWSWMYYDFNQNVFASSPIGLEVTITYDSSAIDFYTVGDYNLVATATDSAGKSVSKNITVHIV